MYHISYMNVYNNGVSGGPGPQRNKHQQRSDTTRRKLLNSARRIFAREGFEAARLEDIAAHAGYTRGAFYANFKSKEELFFALLEQEARENVSDIQRLLEGCADSTARIRALREYYVKRIADRQWVLLMMEFKLYAIRHGRSRAKLVESHRRVRAQSLVQLQSLLPSRLDSHAACGEEGLKAALEGSLSGLVLEQAYDPNRLPPEQAIAILRRIFDALIPGV